MAEKRRGECGMEKKKSIVKYTVVGILVFSMVFSMFAVLISAVQSI